MNRQSANSPVCCVGSLAVGRVLVFHVSSAYVPLSCPVSLKQWCRYRLVSHVVAAFESVHLYRKFNFANSRVHELTEITTCTFMQLGQVEVRSRIHDTNDEVNRTWY